jgi:HSP20 family protein
MIRWDPGKDIMTLKQAINKLFEESEIIPSSFTFQVGEGNIPVDLYQTETVIILKASMAGVRPEEINISVTGDMLIIKAERKEDKEIKDKDYIRKENHYGTISRSVRLPIEVDTDKAEAKFDNGMLILTMPKSEKAKPKQIKIQLKSEHE